MKPMFRAFARDVWAEREVNLAAPRSRTLHAPRAGGKTTNRTRKNKQRTKISKNNLKRENENSPPPPRTNKTFSSAAYIFYRYRFPQKGAPREEEGIVLALVLQIMLGC